MAILKKDFSRRGSRLRKIALAAFLLIIAATLQLVLGSPVWANMTYNFSDSAIAITGSVTFDTNAAGTYQGTSNIYAWQLSWSWALGTLNMQSPNNYIDSVGYTSFTFDPSGNITSWYFAATPTSAGGPPSISISANLPDESPPEYDVVFTSGTGGYAAQYGGEVAGAWTAVPAPASILLLGSGLLGLAGLQRKFKKS